jgi:hypothetical protein
MSQVRMNPDRAKRIGELVGCDAGSVLEILERWTGAPLGRMTEQQIAREVTRYLDELD